MAKQKWGERFLKSGLPLEHLTLTTLTNLGWKCEPKYEYRRINRDGQLAHFEIDLIAYSPNRPKGNLNLFIECKYHDEQRFWFFVPCTTIDHMAQYEALSAGGDLKSNSHMLHYAPYDPLVKPNDHSLIKLAPQSVWGVTISRGGAREENSIYQALEQLGYAFVPFCLDRLYHFCTFEPEAVLPAIVTTAKLFRLKPALQDLDLIRKASSPSDVAEELLWTWCYYAPRGPLLDHNNDEIDCWKKLHSDLEFPTLEEQLAHLWASPHWVLVANINGLADAIQEVYSTFIKLPKDFSKNRLLRRAVEGSAAKRKARKASK
jgi:hypothetical protein